MEPGEHPPIQESVKKPEGVENPARRKFLKILGLTGAVAVTVGAAKALQIINEHPEFPKKAYDSITSGKAIEDIKEIIQSRLRLGNQELSLKNIEAESKYPLEPWMKNAAESVRVLEISQNGKSFPALLFDITQTTSVIHADKKEGNLPGNSLTTKFYDLGAALNRKQALSLPGPQFRQPNKIGEVSRYLQYNMYAWAENQQETAAANFSGQRGGIILTKDGKAIVANPQEFTHFHKDQKGSIQAAIEYSFTIDSDNLETSFKSIEKASSSLLKDILYSCAFSNALVTIYKEDGSFQTFLLASYQPESQFQKEDTISDILVMNPVQLASIAEQLTEKINGKRFVIGITDPSPEAANCYSPWKLTKEGLNQGGYIANEEKYQNWMPELGVQEQYFRTVGTLDNFAFPNNSFSWVLATNK